MKGTLKAYVLPGGALPKRQSLDAGGYDIFTRGIVFTTNDTKPPYMRETLSTLTSPGPTEYLLVPGASVCIGTGVLLQIPKGYVGYLKPRGSTVRNAIRVVNEGVPIDPDFRGEPYAELKNESTIPYPITKGKRIVQLVIHRVYNSKVVSVSSPEKLGTTKRGNGCHGSTGSH